MDVKAAAIIGGLAIVAGLVLYVPAYLLGKYISKKSAPSSQLKGRATKLGIAIYGIMIFAMLAGYLQEHLSLTWFGRLMSSWNGKLAYALTIVVVTTLIEAILKRRGYPLWIEASDDSLAVRMTDARDGSQAGLVRTQDGGMKARFQYLIPDIVEVSLREMARSTVARGWWRRDAMTWATVLGFLGFFVAPGDMLGRTIYAMFVGSAFGLSIYLTDPSAAYAKRLRNYYREQLGGVGPFDFEVEISADAVTFRQADAETKHAWTIVESVSEAPGGIEFIFQPTGRLLVRDRAFANLQERQDFLGLASTLQKNKSHEVFS